MFFGYGLDNINAFTVKYFPFHYYGIKGIPNIIISSIITLGIIGATIAFSTIIINLFKSKKFDFPIFISIIMIASSLGGYYLSWIWQLLFILKTTLDNYEDEYPKDNVKFNY